MAQPKLNRMTAWTVSGVLLANFIWGYFSFTKLWEDDLVVPSPYVTEVKWLSDYFPPLKDTRGDSRVFIVDSGKPGGTLCVMGGTHPDEASGMMSAMVLVEKIQLTEGRMIVLPQTNNSAMTHNFPLDAAPQYIHHKRSDGSVRVYRGASRSTNPVDYWPDPEVFSHYQTGQKLSGEEVRNINRAYPGVEDGTFTERIAFAITKMVVDEKVDLNIDLHEAWPEYPFINAMGVHEKNADMATLAAMEMRMDGIEIRVEMSPPKFRGLSYRELGDYTDAWTALAETPGPNMGRIHGIIDEKLIIEGKDQFYADAAKIGRTFVPFDENGWPISVRVARHLATVDYLARIYTELNPDKPIVFGNMPSYDEVAATPLGDFLNPPPAAL